MRAYSVGCARRRRLWGSTTARSWAGCSGSGRTSSPGSAPTESSATVLRVPDVLGVTFLGRFGRAERSRPRLTPLGGCTRTDAPQCPPMEPILVVEDYPEEAAKGRPTDPTTSGERRRYGRTSPGGSWAERAEEGGMRSGRLPGDQAGVSTARASRSDGPGQQARLTV